METTTTAARLTAATAAHAHRLSWLTEDAPQYGLTAPRTADDLRDAARRAEIDAVDTLSRFVNNLTRDGVRLRDEIVSTHPATAGVCGDWAYRAALIAAEAVESGSLGDAQELGRVSGNLAAAEELRRRAALAEAVATR